MTVDTRPDAAGRMDHRVFEELFRTHFIPLMTFSRRILGNEDDAREVVHQVFIKLWEKREEIDLSSSLKSYLFRSVHNRSLNVIRDRKKFSAEEVPEEAVEWDAEAGMEALELEERIREAIERLPERCGEIFKLSRFEGLRYGEIAVKLELSVKTVENQISKALKILREQLGKYLTVLWGLFLFLWK